MSCFFHVPRLQRCCNLADPAKGKQRISPLESLSHMSQHTVIETSSLHGEDMSLKQSLPCFPLLSCLFSSCPLDIHSLPLTVLHFIPLLLCSPLFSSSSCHLSKPFYFFSFASALFYSPHFSSPLASFQTSFSFSCFTATKYL